MFSLQFYIQSSPSPRVCKESSLLCYLTHRWRTKKWNHVFSKNIRRKWMQQARLKFKLCTLILLSASLTVTLPTHPSDVLSQKRKVRKKISVVFDWLMFKRNYASNSTNRRLTAFHWGNIVVSKSNTSL